MKEGDEDNQPTYVVENSQDTLSKAEYDALVNGQNAEKQDSEDLASSLKADAKKSATLDESNESAKDTIPAKQQVAAIGASNKRKLAKVVGDEEEGADDSVKEKSKANEKKVKAKKGKKVKLSFDEEAA